MRRTLACREVPNRRVRRQRNPWSKERTRARLAFCLLGLLAALTAGILVTISANVRDVELLSRIKDVLSLVVSPVVALLGMALGFYFGVKH